VVYLFLMIWCERWLFFFVDLGGIVDNHCLNFLGIKSCERALRLLQKR
jgi:hypothetical protein